MRRTKNANAKAVIFTREQGVCVTREQGVCAYREGVSVTKMIGVIGFAVVMLSMGMSCSSALGDEPTRNARFYTGVLSDAHAHVVENANPDYIVSEMDRANVDMIIIMRKEDKVSDENMLAYHQQYPNRIVPVIGLQTIGWRDHRPVFLRKVREKVESRQYQWMGEASLRGQVNGQLITPPDSPLLHELLEISAQNRFPVTIHHNAFDAREIRLFVDTLAKHPLAIVIWAHWCGLGDPAKVRSWLEQFPNLYCDLGWLHQDQSAFPNRLVDDSGQFVPGWKELIESHPDRFLAAINASEVEDFKEQYQMRAEKVRQALGGLAPATASKVATENLHRLLGR
jgi:hypothetical protein